MIHPVWFGLVVLLLSPLLGQGAAAYVLAHHLPHIVGFYIILIPPLCVMGYLSYYVSKQMKDK